MANGDRLPRWDRLCWFLSRHGPAVLGVILVLTGILGSGAWKIRGDVLLQELFPYEHPYLQLQARFSQVIGGGSSAERTGWPGPSCTWPASPWAPAGWG